MCATLPRVLVLTLAFHLQVVSLPKVIWSLIVVILLHSFFTCAVAAGHVEDNDHTFDYAHQDHTHNDQEAESPDNIDPDHEHQFHAHISCITGYSLTSAAIPCPNLAISHRLLPFDSNDNQPPTPPPNA